MKPSFLPLFTPSCTPSPHPQNAAHYFLLALVFLLTATTGGGILAQEVSEPPDSVLSKTPLKSDPADDVDAVGALGAGALGALSGISVGSSFGVLSEDEE